MRALELLRLHLRTALATFAHAPILSMVSIVTMAATLTVLGAHQLLYGALSATIADLGVEARVAFALKDGVRPGDRLALERELRALPDVERVEMIDAASARDSLRRVLGAQAAVLEALPENPLPTSLEVSLRSGRRSVAVLRALAARFGKHPAVDEVVTAEAAVGRLEAEIELLHVAGTTLAVFLLVATLLLVGSTIRLTVYARRDEISVMKVCGATDTFVRTPFLIEGVFHGIAGTAIAAGVLFAAHAALAAPLADLLSRAVGLPIRVASPSAAFVLGLLAVAVGVGLVGSAISVRRFLRT